MRLCRLLVLICLQVCRLAMLELRKTALFVFRFPTICKLRSSIAWFQYWSVKHKDPNARVLMKMTLSLIIPIYNMLMPWFVFKIKMPAKEDIWK